MNNAPEPPNREYKPPTVYCFSHPHVKSPLMLELSTLELQALVQSELQQNPMLEEVGHSSVEPGTILPDLIARRAGADYVVTINDRAFPRLRVPETYESLVAQPKVPAEVKEYVREKTAAAKRLIESLEQHREALLAIGRAIVKFQKDFLENPSISIMRMPLPPVEGLEETNASQLLSNKYIETSSGVFELALFFPKKAL